MNQLRPVLRHPPPHLYIHMNQRLLAGQQNQAVATSPPLGTTVAMTFVSG